MTSLDIDDSVDRIVTLISQGQSFSISANDCKLSKLLETTLSSDPTATEIPVLYGTSEHLAEVVTFLQRHKGETPAEILKPLISGVMKEVTNEEDAAQVDAMVAQHNVYYLYDVLSLANYLDIPSMLDLCGSKIASMIKNKPVQDIENILNPEKRVGNNSSSSTHSPASNVSNVSSQSASEIASEVATEMKVN